MYKITQVGGWPGGEAFLIESERAALLLDTGYAFSARCTVENTRKELGEKPLDMIFLTHSHYDHASGCARVKEAYPHAEVVASAEAAAVFMRPNAIKTMQALDDVAAARTRLESDSQVIENIHVDRKVADGDVVRCGDMRIRVMAAPGHTKCSVNLYFEDADLLALCETTGVAPEYPAVQPTYITSYAQTVETLERARALGAKHLFIPHGGLVPDADVQDFFCRARAVVDEAKDIIIREHKAGKDVEGIVEAVARRYYVASLAEYQPYEAFALNFSVLAQRVLLEFGYVE